MLENKGLSSYLYSKAYVHRIFKRSNPLYILNTIVDCTKRSTCFGYINIAINILCLDGTYCTFECNEDTMGKNHLNCIDITLLRGINININNSN